MSPCATHRHHPHPDAQSRIPRLSTAAREAPGARASCSIPVAPGPLGRARALRTEGKRGHGAARPLP